VNNREHVFIGIIIFFVYNFFNNTIINSVLYPLIGISISTMWYYGVILAIIGSLIPDKLEPAYHWNHRDKFHSKKTLRISCLIFSITAIIGLFSPLSFYISCFFLGYFFHLIADSQTKVGLPEGWCGEPITSDITILKSELVVNTIGVHTFHFISFYIIPLQMQGIHIQSFFLEGVFVQAPEILLT